MLATLGLKTSSLKMVSKKEIQQLTIPDICDTIIKIENTIPLRQSSNLLYGITLAYKHKTEYSYSKFKIFTLNNIKTNDFSFKLTFFFTIITVYRGGQFYEKSNFQRV